MGNAKILKTLLFLIFFFALCFSTYADDELYVWEENGITHYSKTKPNEWKVDNTGPKWESAGTIEFPPLYEKKDKQISNDTEATKQISNVVVSKRRYINLIERREQAMQNTINGMESKISEMESKMRERRGGGVVVTPSGVYPVVGP